MKAAAIIVADLGKRYEIRARRERYRTLRDALTSAASAPVRRVRSALARRSVSGRSREDIIWALHDVSFEVQQGDVVGVIGRNGAGKTTLLKILSRITEPTVGYAAIRGRVGSLLEVGTGFHPELTGRENVFLNGAILGMARAEVIRKFDEIVAFAEVERFIDTPIKRYSSGMHMRLAFAVAAFLEPEIMLVDEVLAVGDARFQKKCLNKMQDVGQEGRTILFVSHSMPAVTRLCERTILLDDGTIVDDGPTARVVSEYLSSGLGTTTEREWDDPAQAPGGEVARLRAVRVCADDGPIADAADIRRPVKIEMEYDVLEHGHVLLPNVHFYNEQGIEAFGSNDLDPTWRGRPRPAGRYVSTVQIPGNFLSEGMLFVRPALITVDPVVVQFSVSEAVAFHVIDRIGGGDSARGDYAGAMRGVVRPILEWTTRASEDGDSSGPRSHEEGLLQGG
jgi:lipopolysaccharide transport system ATP-binding protein